MLMCVYKCMCDIHLHVCVSVSLCFHRSSACGVAWPCGYGTNADFAILQNISPISQVYVCLFVYRVINIDYARLQLPPE